MKTIDNFMKVLLLRPNRCYYKGSMSIKVGIPLGLMYVAAAIEKAGHEVTIFDSLSSKLTEKWVENGITHYGVRSTEIVRVIDDEKPDIVGSSILFTAQLQGLSDLTRMIKMNFKDLPVIVGGAHISAAGESYLKENPAPDFGIVGEGEKTIVELLEYLSDKRDIKSISGLIWRNGSEVIENKRREMIKDIDAIPFPAYHKVDMENYLEMQEKGVKGRALAGKRNISMITSRGCPYKCTFCSIYLHMGRKFRAHSPDYVRSHIEHVVKTYDVKSISFEDDTLTQNAKRFNKILDSILDRNLKFTWNTPNGIRADISNRETLIKMKQSGCTDLTIGVESGSERVLKDVIKKKLDLNKVIRSAKLCKEVEIPLQAFFIIGMPGETLKEIQITLDFAYMLTKKYRCYPSLGVFTPLIGTPMYDYCLKKRYILDGITPEMLSTGNKPGGRKVIVETEEFSRWQIQEMGESFLNRIASLKRSRRLISIDF